MQVQDITVEIRNAALERIGQFTPNDLAGFVMVMRYNNVGSWSITIPANSRYADIMRQPGTGIIVSYGDDVIMSGSMTSATLQQSTDNLVGDWIIEGADDSVILTERLAYPVPSTSDLAAQIDPYDVRSGAAETVIKGYVRDNISAEAGTNRATSNFWVTVDEGRGYDVNAQARFETLQELIYPLAQTGGIGYRVEQVTDYLEFQVYEPIDRSAYVRMDLENGRLSSAEYSYLLPNLTRAIVGGDGDGAYRALLEGSNTESLAAEALWGRRIERFIDGRGTTDSDELTQSANEALIDNGKTIVNLSVTPADGQTMRFGYDWNLGDKITVVAGQIEASAIVTEVGISIGSDGVRLAATVGTPAPITYEAKLAAKQESQNVRISNLERNTAAAGGGGVIEGGLPTGGVAGQFLTKVDATNYNATWTTHVNTDVNLYVKNAELAGYTITKGQVVMAVGAQADHIEVRRALADGTIEPKYMLGVAASDIPAGEFGYIILLGVLAGIDTSIWPVGTVLYLDPNVLGGLTSTEPSTPDVVMPIAIVTRSQSINGRIYVRMYNQQSGLHELHDVLIPSPQLNDVLTYDGAKWVNTQLSVPTIDVNPILFWGA